MVGPLDQQLQSEIRQWHQLSTMGEIWTNDDDDDGPYFDVYTMTNDDARAKTTATIEEHVRTARELAAKIQVLCDTFQKAVILPVGLRTGLEMWGLSGIRFACGFSLRALLTLGDRDR